MQSMDRSAAEARDVAGADKGAPSRSAEVRGKKNDLR